MAEFVDNSGLRMTRGERRRVEDDEVTTKKEPEKAEPLGVEAKKHKKTLGQKFSETFIKGDISDVGAHIVKDILLPSAVETLGDMGHNLVDGMIYGEGNAPSRSYRSRQTRERSSLDRGRRNRSGVPVREERSSRRSTRSSRDFSLDDIWVDSRAKAVKIRDDMVDRIDVYGHAKVSDLYDALEWDWDYPKFDWGWYDLSYDNTKIYRVYDKEFGWGYTVEFPKPVYLEER